MRCRGPAGGVSLDTWLSFSFFSGMMSETPAPPPTPVVPPAPRTPSADVAAPSAPPPQRRQLSCLGRTIVAFVDGGTFGAAIGSIIATAQGVSGIAGGVESPFGALRSIVASGWRSGVSLGFALAGCACEPSLCFSPCPPMHDLRFDARIGGACFRACACARRVPRLADQGGVCSLERWRARKDALNPFVVGGLMGVVGSIQRVDYHDGRTKSRAFAINPRAMLASGTSSALLCTLFWYINQPSKKQREAQEQALAAAGRQAQQVPPLPQQPGQAATLAGAAAAAAGVPAAAPIAAAGELLTDGEARGELDAGLLPTTGLAQGLLPELLSGVDEPEPAAEVSGLVPAAELSDAPAEPAFADPWAKGK